MTVKDIITHKIDVNTPYKIGVMDERRGECFEISDTFLGQLNDKALNSEINYITFRYDENQKPYIYFEYSYIEGE